MDIGRLLFTITYVVVDLMYVVFSKPAYDAVVKDIQGVGMTLSGPGDYLAMMGAYTCMAIGWYVIVAGTVKTWVKSMNVPPYVAGALAGFVYGLATIGMFNFTVHIMFKKYDWPIVARDMAWGIGWQTIIAAMYAVYITKY